MPITQSWQRELDQEAMRREAQRILELAAHRERYDATRAQGLVPCDCGAVASCWIRSQKMHFSGARCPSHAEAAVHEFRAAKLLEKEYDVVPVNLDYWMAVVR